MPRISDDDLKALRAKHSRGLVVLNVLNEDGESVHDFVFKKIDRTAYAQYRAANKHAMASGGGSGEEEQQLARQLLVWPDDNKAAFDELRESAPAVATNFGAELLVDATAGFSVDRDPR